MSTSPANSKWNESHVRELWLQENVAGGRGRNTTVSVLNPSITIERTKTEDPEENEYRIITTFNLQVKIHAFEKGYRKKHDKLFDYISLRYLYHRGDKHGDIKPDPDQVVHIHQSEETTKSRWIEASLSGDPSKAAAGISPTVGVHVQRDNKLTYDRDSESWRKGFSFESYYPTPFGEAAWPGTASVDHIHHQHNFQVVGKHNSECKCEDHRSPCPLRNPGSRIGPCGDEEWVYDRCAHWFWQTEASAHLWTPEIYESYTAPITVTRKIYAKPLDDAKNDPRLEIWKKARQYLHFDFVVTIRLRELGWKKMDGFLPTNIFSKYATKPAEARVKDDFGYPMKRDRVAFCVCACPARINWPEFRTMDRQKVANEEVAEKGPTVTKVEDSEGFIKVKKEKKERQQVEENKVKEDLDKSTRAKEEEWEKELEELERIRRTKLKTPEDSTDEVSDDLKHHGSHHHGRHHQCPPDYSSSSSSSSSPHFRSTTNPHHRRFRRPFFCHQQTNHYCACCRCEEHNADDSNPDMPAERSKIPIHEIRGQRINEFGDCKQRCAGLQFRSRCHCQCLCQSVDYEANLDAYSSDCSSDSFTGPSSYRNRHSAHRWASSPRNVSRIRGERLARAKKREGILRDKQKKLEETDSEFREEMHLWKRMKELQRLKHIQYLKQRQTQVQKEESILVKTTHEETRAHGLKSDTESVLSEGDYPRVFLPLKGMKRLKKGELKEVESTEVPHKRQVIIEHECEPMFNQTRGRSSQPLASSQMRQKHQPPRSYSAHPEARFGHHHSHSRRAASFERHRSEHCHRKDGNR